MSGAPGSGSGGEGRGRAPALRASDHSTPATSGAPSARSRAPPSRDGSTIQMPASGSSGTGSPTFASRRVAAAADGRSRNVTMSRARPGSVRPKVA